MKQLRNFEIDALAERVYEELEKVQYAKIPKSVETDFNKIDAEIQTLTSSIEELKKMMDANDAKINLIQEKFKKKYNITHNRYYYDRFTLDWVKEKIVELPSKSTIRQEVVLNGMVANREELDVLIQKLVTKFSETKK